MREYILEEKFTVINNANARRYLSDKSQRKLEKIKRKIADGILLSGKDNPEYIVINRDEPYANEILDILVEHGVIEAHDYADPEPAPAPKPEPVYEEVENPVFEPIPVALKRCEHDHPACFDFACETWIDGREICFIHEGVVVRQVGKYVVKAAEKADRGFKWIGEDTRTAHYTDMYGIHRQLPTKLVEGEPKCN